MRTFFGNLLILLAPALVCAQTPGYQQSGGPLPVAPLPVAPATPPPTSVNPLRSPQPGSPAPGGGHHAAAAAFGGGAPAVPPAGQPDFAAARQPVAPQTAAQTGQTRSSFPWTDIPDDALSPTELMDAMLQPQRGSRLAGRPLSLAGAIDSLPTRGEQTQAIFAYWDLCASLADYNLGLLEAQELQILQGQLSGVGGAGNAVSRAAAKMRSRLATSEAAAIAAQHRLASLTKSRTLPLPSDAPLATGYLPRYEEWFVNRPSPEAQNLSGLIGFRFQEVEYEAEAVARGEDWVQHVAAIQTQNSTGAGILRAMELLALNRRAFVQLVKGYNCQITRYTELATPGRIDNGRLVNMLIGKRPTAAAATARGGSPGSQLNFRSPR